MSKGSLFWANASGKLGESVFYRSGGEQRNRSYVKNVKNPKTEAQMRNRIQMGNWAAMYRRLKPILEKTFTNRPSAESGFNALVKANKSRLRYAVDKTMLEDCDYHCLGAKVSSGTIICNIQPEFYEYSEPINDLPVPSYFTKMLSLSDVPFVIRKSWYEEDSLLGKELFSLLTANGNPMQLPSDFKVIVLYGSYELDDETGEYSESAMPLSYRIYTCNSTDETTGVFVGNGDLEHKTLVYPVLKDYVSAGRDADIVGNANVDGLLIGKAVAPEENNYDCFGMIIYYENSTGKNANNAFIYGYQNAESAAADFAEGGFVFDQILENAGYNASSALSGSSGVRKPDLKPYTILGKQFQIFGESNNEEYGTVEGSGYYTVGSRVKLTAVPKEGYKFVKWSNDETANPLYIRVYGDETIEAEFAAE